MNNSPTPLQMIVLGAGGALLIGSFLPWLSSDDFSLNAWGSTFGISLFPVYLLPALVGVLAAGSLALELFSSVRLPERVLTFTRPQLRVVAGFWASVTMVVAAIDNSDGKGIGLWLSLLASAALLVGAVLEMKASDGTASHSSPPQAF